MRQHILWVMSEWEAGWWREESEVQWRPTCVPGGFGDVEDLYIE